MIQKNNEILRNLGTQNLKHLLIASVTNCHSAGKSLMIMLSVDIISIMSYVSVEIRKFKMGFCENGAIIRRNEILLIESTQLEDPRQEWKSIQEQMLREYLTSAQDVLVAKKEIYDVKHQRLLLAQDEYDILNALAASRNSCMYTPNTLNSHYD